jgi:hypothetical protein
VKKQAVEKQLDNSNEAVFIQSQGYVPDPLSPKWPAWRKGETMGMWQSAGTEAEQAAGRSLETDFRLGKTASDASLAHVHLRQTPKHQLDRFIF